MALVYVHLFCKHLGNFRKILGKVINPHPQPLEKNCLYAVIQYKAHANDIMAAILMFQNNETAAMLVYQTNPVRVQLFSYVNAFFCHVGVPNQSCGGSTLFLC